MSKLSEKLLASGFPRPVGNSSVLKALHRAPVDSSGEFIRILNLPRRKLTVEKDGSVTLESSGKVEKIPDITPVFACRGGRMKLRPLQTAALWEAQQNNGGFFPISVGGGKTLIALLLPEAMNSKRAVLLVKPELRNQLLKRDIPLYRKHFNLPLNRIFVVAYSELSSAKKAEILERIKPDLVICDEGHKLRIKSSARTRRFLRYMKKYPTTRLVTLSGSFMRRSLMDYAHLLTLALKDKAPIPNNYKDLEDWAEAIDITEDPKPPGVLSQFCTPEENVREGFQRRLTETPGVVASTDSSIGTSLLIIERALEKPSKVESALKDLYATWQIEEEELTDAMSLMRVARQLCCGFYYKWDWPGGIKDEEWVRARRAWHREIRGRLLHTNISGMDSPLLLFNAARDGRWKSETFGGWVAVKDRPEPPTIPVWIDHYMLKDAIRWGRQQIKNGEGGIIWYEHHVIGEMIARAGGWNLYGQGADASLVDKNKEPVIVCSIKAQSEGKNLQSWSKALVTSPPASGAAWEQLIGRLHRPGQQADEVEYHVYLHTPEFKNAFEKALEDAVLIEETQGQRQKLNSSQIIRKLEVNERFDRSY